MVPNRAWSPRHPLSRIHPDRRIITAMSDIDMAIHNTCVWLRGSTACFVYCNIGCWRAGRASPRREICEDGNAFPVAHSSLLRRGRHHRRGLLLPQEPVQEVGTVVPDFKPA